MIARFLRTTGLGACLGLIAGANIAALLAVAIGGPIAGPALITIHLLPGAFGALCGACKEY